MSNYRIGDEALAEIFKALSNPHRLALFQRLTRCCPLGTKCKPEETERYCVGELGKGVKIAASTLSHHLKELHRAGLIEMQRNGKNVECWVDPATLNSLSHFFSTKNKPPLKGTDHE